MTFEQTLHQRFTCKAFKDESIPGDVLEFILDAGRLAPSSCGFEPWKFVVLSQKKDNEDLSKACFNQENVATASNNIIILARTDLRIVTLSCKIKSRVLPHAATQLTLSAC